MAKQTWTARRDEVLLEVLRRSSDDYRAAAGAIKRLTRGLFHPSPRRCEERARTIRTANDLVLSTRVNSSPRTLVGRPRVKPPIATRLPPPPTLVLSVPAELHVGDLVQGILSALPPGWTWEHADPDETRSDAIASARHQATLRGAQFVVVENHRGRWPAVATIEPGHVHQRVAELRVVRIKISGA